MFNFLKYVRQMGLENFGDEGQSRLSFSSVALVGVGGVGSAVLPLLVGAGIGRISIFDCDVVSESNLHRQTLYTENDIGYSKAKLAEKYAQDRNSDCDIKYFSERFAMESAKKANFDVCIDATDSFASRKEIAEVCRALRARVVGASAEGFVSQNFLFGDDFYFDDVVGENVSQEPSKNLNIFPPSAHLSGVWAAGEVVKSIVFERFEVGAFRMFDSLSMKYYSGNLR